MPVESYLSVCIPHRNGYFLPIHRFMYRLSNNKNIHVTSHIEDGTTLTLLNSGSGQRGWPQVRPSLARFSLPL